MSAAFSPGASAPMSHATLFCPATPIGSET